MKFFIFLLSTTFSTVVFAASETGRAVVSIDDVEATVRVEGDAARALFESLEVSRRTHGLTAIKETREVACFEYRETAKPTYTCSIFIFVTKDFISLKSRYSAETQTSIDQ